MFCPECGVHFAESDAVKRNIKYMGSVVVEYDARCPGCGIEIGKVSWGHLMMNPKLSGGELEDFGDEEEKPSGGLIPPPPELRTILRPRKRAGTGGEEAASSQVEPITGENPLPEEQAPLSELHEFTEPTVKTCPCCGQPWPEGTPYPD